MKPVHAASAAVDLDGLFAEMRPKLHRTARAW